MSVWEVGALWTPQSDHFLDAPYVIITTPAASSFIFRAEVELAESDGQLDADREEQTMLEHFRGEDIDLVISGIAKAPGPREALVGVGL